MAGFQTKLFVWNSGILLVITARARARVSRQPSRLRRCRWSHGPTGPLLADVRRSRRLDVANDAHGAGETLAPPPLETAGIDGTLLELAGDAVPVSIQLLAVSRIAPIQGSCSRLLRLLAVGKVHALLPRLRHGRGSRRATAGLSLLFWCRLWLRLLRRLRLLHERLQRRLRGRGLRRRNRRRRRRRTRGRGRGWTRSR